GPLCRGLAQHRELDGVQLERPLLLGLRDAVGHGSSLGPRPSTTPHGAEMVPTRARGAVVGRGAPRTPSSADDDAGHGTSRTSATRAPRDLVPYGTVRLACEHQVLRRPRGSA